MDVIDWNIVNWLGVTIFVVLVFIAALVANFLNMIFDGNPIIGAILTAALFGALFIGWTYYPHGIDVGQEKLPPAGATINAPSPY